MAVVNKLSIAAFAFIDEEIGVETFKAIIAFALQFSSKFRGF